MIDFLVVGHGIAGCCISHILNSKGASFKVIDSTETSTSEIASGIINPITGRRYVKSWLVEDLIDFAIPFYQSLSESIQRNILNPIKIIRIFGNLEEVNDWSTRVHSNGFERFVADKNIVHLPKVIFKNKLGAFEITEGYKVSCNKLIAAWSEKLYQDGLFIQETFKHDQLMKHESGWTYKNQDYKNVIFCEGNGVRYNPHFSHLPFQYVKGEVLIFTCPSIPKDRIINKQGMIVPLDADRFWFGSTYGWGDTAEGNTQEGVSELTDRLENILNCKYTITDTLVGLRSTVVDRKPIIGSTEEGLNIFNGMGTKGYSLAPYFANHLIEHILDGKMLMKEVDLNRFDK